MWGLIPHINNGGMMNNTKFVIGLFVSNTGMLKTIEPLMKSIEKIEKLLSLSLNSFSMSYVLNDKEQTKTLKFTKKNLEKLYLIDINSLSFLSFQVLKSSKDFGDTLLSINFPMNISETQATIISIIIDETIFSEKDATKDILSIINILDLENYNFQFSFAFLMEKDKLPDFYIMGIGSPNLSIREEKIIDALNGDIKHFANKIWDFFWINIIKEAYIDSESLQEIIAIVGHENVYRYNHRCIVKIPLNSEEYTKNIYKRYEYIEKLRPIFERKNLIMCTNEIC